ncbi:DUF1671-domain-containing protein [Aspergillus granulosus]|uniref:Adenylate kinase isoenzyme 6 homolog n=1 Tax=Aspergillus granulosus TaxID=176169 RepID=A0ABR4H2F9_9EURO
MNRQSSPDPVCPFCPFSDPDGNFVAEHVQYCHPENGLQAEQQRTTPTRGAPEYQMSDPCESADEFFSDRSSHSLSPGDRITLEEYFAFEQSPSRPQVQKDGVGDRVQAHHPSRQTTLRNEKRKDHSQQASSTKTLNGTIKRLGRSELGPYAHEKKMPSWLLKMLEKGNTTSRVTKITPDGKLSRHVVIENQTPNVVPALAHLCDQDKSVQRAFFCSAHIHQISKMPMEGSFCGYRNIQMLVSYIQESRGPGHNHFPSTLPTILQLQDMIERAWDMGFNSVGRTETGGIKGTRKYIGTSEAQALFSSLGIGCEASSIGKANGIPAHSALLSQVAAYFKSACPLDKNEKVVLTSLPPIYFQHHGHSMTIIGFEIRDKGTANLLVFDPTYKTPAAIKHSNATKIKTSNPARILKGYRRGGEYLQKYQNFEILKYNNYDTMRTSPNIIITGTPGVGKTVHCEQLALDTGLRHLSINQIAKDRGCYDTYDEELKTWVVDEDKLLDAIEDEVLQGGFLIDWHACDLFPKSWIDLVVVLRCPSTSIHYDRLSSRGYHETKLQENLDAEIFAVLLEEAREAFDEEIVVELNSEEDGDVDANCSRIASWVENWKSDRAKNSD